MDVFSGFTAVTPVQRKMNSKPLTDGKVFGIFSTLTSLVAVCWDPFWPP